MPTIKVHDAVDPATGTAVGQLLEAVEQATGRSALSDHLAVDLARGGGDGFVAVTAIDGASGELVAYAQATAANESYALELVLDPTVADRAASIGRDLIDVALTAIRERRGGVVNWLVADPSADHEDVAAGLGLEPTRRLFQMRRPLPTGAAVEIETRSAVVGADDEAWLEVNNLAFEGHDEQGGWTIETLRRRQAEPWFDPADVRIHERDGRLAGFCWTKVHHATDHEPELGEIYVIAVHPDFHGQGLGRQLTLAGLEHLAGHGITTGMLWVDADNTIAVHLYERLGFSVTATTVAFTADVHTDHPPPDPSTSGAP